MENQNQNNQLNQPDYNFIVNQPTPDLNNKKPINKKLIIIIVLAVITLLVVLLTVLIGGRTNELAPQSQDADTFQNSVTATIATDYLQYIKDGEPDKSYDLLSQNLKQEYDFEFFESVVPEMYSNIDNQDCNLLKDKFNDENDEHIVELECGLIETPETDASEEESARKSKEILFIITQEDQDYKINQIDMLGM